MQIQLDPLTLYRSSFKSQKTATYYLFYLKKYANDDILSLTTLSQKEAKDRLIHFVVANNSQYRIIVLKILMP